MNILELAKVDMVLKRNEYETLQHGPFKPWNELKISRDKNLMFYIKTSPLGRASANQLLKEKLEGNHAIVLKNKINDCEISIEGLYPKNYLQNPEGTLPEIYGALSVIVDFSKKRKNKKYTIDWLENIDDNCALLWPLQSKCLINLPKKLWALTAGRQYVYCKVDGNDFLLIKNQESNKNTDKASGFILYNNSSSDEVRWKIKNCLSFLLGRPLICTGYSILDKNCDLVLSNYHYAETNKELFLKMTTSPPVLLDSTRAGIVQRITGTILSAKLDKIYSNYEKYDLSYLFWLFWHAACDDTSPNGIMLYAACIEALQKKYSDENNGTILAPKDWHALLGELKDKVLQVNMQEKLKNQLITNLELINRRGLKQRKLDNFLDHLGLKLNRNEREAWAHRHNVAHGDCITADYKAFMKATKILKTIFTRILLCVTGASDEYIDYCYEGCPIKNIKSGDEVQINDN